MVLSLGIRSESASLAAERYVLWAMIPLTACEFSASSAGRTMRSYRSGQLRAYSLLCDAVSFPKQTLVNSKLHER